MNEELQRLEALDILERKHKCKFSEEATVTLGGIYELDPCMYDLKEEHRNVTVRVYQCPICKTVDISWERQENTETTIYGALEE